MVLLQLSTVWVSEVVISWVTNLIQATNAASLFKVGAYFSWSKQQKYSFSLIFTLSSCTQGHTHEKQTSMVLMWDVFLLCLTLRSSPDGCHWMWQWSSLLSLSHQPSLCCLPPGKAFASFQQPRIWPRVTCKSHHPRQYQNATLVSQPSHHSSVSPVLGGLWMQANWKQLLAALAVRLSCRRRNSECWRSGPGSQSCFPYTFSNLFSFSASTCKLLKFLDFK